MSLIEFDPRFKSALKTGEVSLFANELIIHAATGLGLVIEGLQGHAPVLALNAAEFFQLESKMALMALGVAGMAAAVDYLTNERSKLF